MTLRKLKDIKARIKEEDLSKDIIPIEIPRTCSRLARCKAEEVTPRYPASYHWKERELENNFYAFLNELALLGVLIQWKIPSVYAEPVFEDEKIYRSFRGGRFDFIIGGKIFEVKTIPPEKDRIRVMIKKKAWDGHKSDFVIVTKHVKPQVAVEEVNGRKTIKILGNRGEALLYGYLTRDDVDKLPVRNWKYGLSYWTYLDQDRCKREGMIPLRPASELMSLILKHRVLERF